MATIDQIMEAAHELGKLIAETEVAKKFEKAAKALGDDVQAQRTMNDYNRMMETLARKQAAGDPIEVDEKRKLEALQNQIISSKTLREVQMAQMDYLDLLRRVDEKIAGDAPQPDSAAPETPEASSLINPE